MICAPARRAAATVRRDTHGTWSSYHSGWGSGDRTCTGSTIDRFVATGNDGSSEWPKSNPPVTSPSNGRPVSSQRPVGPSGVGGRRCVENVQPAGHVLQQRTAGEQPADVGEPAVRARLHRRDPRERRRGRGSPGAQLHVPGRLGVSEGEGELDGV